MSVKAREQTFERLRLKAHLERNSGSFGLKCTLQIRIVDDDSSLASTEYVVPSTGTFRHLHSIPNPTIQMINGLMWGGGGG